MTKKGSMLEAKEQDNNVNKFYLKGTGQGQCRVNELKES